MKVVSQDALTKLIQLSKDNFIDKNDTVQATTVPLATVATTGDYEDLINTPPSIPSQTGQSGKFLTTNGTDASWASILTYSSGTGIDITNNTISVTSPVLTNNATNTNNENSIAIFGSVDDGMGGEESNAIAIGFNSEAQAAGVALGNNAYGPTYGVAIGKDAICAYESVVVGYSAESMDESSVVVGCNAAADRESIAIGHSAEASGAISIAIGKDAIASGFHTIQIGAGTNSTASTIQFGDYTILNRTNGLIPQARLASGGTNGQVLTTNGTTMSWADASGSTITYWEDD